MQHKNGKKSKLKFIELLNSTGKCSDNVMHSKKEISLYPLQTVFVGGYTVLTLSVLPTRRACTCVRNTLFL